MKFRGVLTFSMIVLGAGFLSGSGGQPSNGLGGNVLEALPRDLEMQWALSAIPVYLRSDATVYIVDPAKGYVVAKQGGNGFNCFVERTDYVREYYRNDLIYPLCFDPEGSETIMPVSFDVAQIRAERKVSPAALHQEIMRKFKDGIYRSTARPGISYMLSPVTRL